MFAALRVKLLARKHPGNTATPNARDKTVTLSRVSQDLNTVCEDSEDEIRELITQKVTSTCLKTSKQLMKIARARRQALVEGRGRLAWPHHHERDTESKGVP